MDEKYYKVLGGECRSPCKQFDYSPYLPKGESAGEWLPLIENAKIASDGYYISKYWNMWYSKGARIYEVEFDRRAESKVFAVEDQICCGTIRLLKDVTDELVPLLNDENCNLGKSNTGTHNIGNFNVGERNTGNRNTGKLNSGDFNTGDNNTGIDNVGDKNVGSANVGSLNTGHSNTGDGNLGSYNSGHFNRGNCNSGSFNVGNRNSGKWNIGNRNTGFFNTRGAPFYMFDKPVENADASQVAIPAWLNNPEPKKSFESAPIGELKKTLELPNFDFDIFEKITGVSKADYERRFAAGK